MEWARTHHSHPQGLIFIPPLIGGHLSQQFRTFRWLIRRGYDLLSFNFSGHGTSSNRFSITQSLHDTGHMLRYTVSAARRERLPLFGIASCYGAIPLLHAAHRMDPVVRRIILVNPIPGIRPGAVLASFISHYLKISSRQGGFARLESGLRHYADSLFPNVTKGRDHFGTLPRHRADLSATLREFLTLNPLADVCLKDTPVLCLHVRNDAILDIYDARQDYRDSIRKLCPQTRFQRLEGNHFFTDPEARRRAARSITSFLVEPA